MEFPAAALDLMLVVLGDRDGDLRDLVLLVAVHDTEVPGGVEVPAAVAAALREPVTTYIGVIGPRQMRTRRPGLLAPRPFRPTPAARLVRRRGLARVIVFRGRVLIRIDLADDVVVRFADERGVERPRPLVAGGALVGLLAGCSAW